MRNLIRIGVIVCVSGVLTFGSGCVMVIASGCTWDRSPSAWTEETVTVELVAGGLTAMNIQSPNGTVNFTGTGSGEASILARKRAGGSSVEDARNALAAIEIVSERNGGKQQLSWRWKGEKRSRWAGSVDFTVQASDNINLDIQTHNGEIKAGGVVGDVNLLTNNGAIVVDARQGRLRATSHNGSITANYDGPRIDVDTHNGGVRVDLRRAGVVGGTIATHNGSVDVQVSASTAAEVEAHTHNGQVNSQAPIEAETSSRTRLKGKLGSGGEKLELSTHNGSITIKTG